MSANIENILETVIQLPLGQQKQLVEKIEANIKSKKRSKEEIEEALAVLESTRGSIGKGLDRETLISLAEDEEFCGY